MFPRGFHPIYDTYLPDVSKPASFRPHADCPDLLYCFSHLRHAVKRPNRDGPLDTRRDYACFTWMVHGFLREVRSQSFLLAQHSFPGLPALDDTPMFSHLCFAQQQFFHKSELRVPELDDFCLKLAFECSDTDTALAQWRELRRNLSHRRKERLYHSDAMLLQRMFFLEDAPRAAYEVPREGLYKKLDDYKRIWSESY